MTEKTPEGRWKNVVTRHYEIDICDGCINLVGSMCDTPGCALCFMRTPQIKEFLQNALLIARNVSGEMVRTQDRMPING